ncbi:hypothetical protein PZ61_0211495 [Streptomyces sp. MNU77]|nr:hypothetical protein PZ61_0211495 [Streptomyces sp. MNU77]
MGLHLIVVKLSTGGSEPRAQSRVCQGHVNLLPGGRPPRGAAGSAYGDKSVSRQSRSTQAWQVQYLLDLGEDGHAPVDLARARPLHHPRRTSGPEAFRLRCVPGSLHRGP